MVGIIPFRTEQEQRTCQRLDLRLVRVPLDPRYRTSPVLRRRSRPMLSINSSSSVHIEAPLAASSARASAANRA